jgi:lipopolysaccharide/colanic/teichoic acid biosynthesis glycosyltransferase
LRRQVNREERVARTIAGRAFDGLDDAQVSAFVAAAVSLWTRPDLAVAGLTRLGEGVWTTRCSKVDERAALLGSAWVGKDRVIGADRTIVGPTVLWDKAGEESLAVAPDARHWTKPPAAQHPRSGHDAVYVPGKRVFDLAFALLGLCLTLPLYPILMLLIWIEDGRPFFFSQRREGRGGREFRCWKFRSMRKNADRMQRDLRSVNQADGPQFYMKDDPRLTHVGAWLRKLNLDELPQFWNVLKGDMSVVGPRPSPHRENQFCPEWREARLSVRPGITGLWQVMRTRRAGCDFQEWVQYDTQYVERASWRLDLWIIARTLFRLLHKGGH